MTKQRGRERGTCPDRGWEGRLPAMVSGMCAGVSQGVRTGLSAVERAGVKGSTGSR